MPLSESKTAMEKADPNYESIYHQIGQYWGEQPGTSGPVYVGAFVMMLFILGLFIVKGPALLAATILSILLSWGKNFMGFTDFFLDYVPMYAKFRTVASILVIAEFTIPLLAMLALKEVLSGEVKKEKLKVPLIVSFVLTGGIAMLFSLMPSFFFGSFISSSEMHALQTLPPEHIQPLIANLTLYHPGRYGYPLGFPVGQTEEGIRYWHHPRTLSGGFVDGEQALSERRDVRAEE